jgi:ribonuclease-3
VPEPRPFAELEAILGYLFRDPRLLETALRHASWCNEQDKELGKLEDNQRLEFLGDSVLSLTVSQRLMARFPDAHEGDLSVTRAQVVSEEGLSEVARQLGFGRHLLLGRGEERSGGRDKPKILADAFEAIVAAVYLDGGFEAARALSARLLEPRIAGVDVRGVFDFKTRLQEAAQAKLRETPEYRVIAASGPDHDKTFEVGVVIGGQVWATATGKSKKEAEQRAAEAATALMESAASV